MSNMFKAFYNKMMAFPLNKYHTLLESTLKGQVQEAKKGDSTFKINQTLSLNENEIIDLYGGQHKGVAKKLLRDELKLYMDGEIYESKYREKGIKWWEYCSPTLINTYPTYFAKLPALLKQINEEKRPSKNYVLFIGETGTETNQLPCLSLIQFQIIPDCWGDKFLHMTVYQRSADANLGLISDMYQMWQIAQMIDVSLGSITFFIGNCHIYNNNIDTTKTMLEDKRNGDYSKTYKFNLNT